jgi:DNA-binding transcriptional ArsR family regulator
MPPDRRDRYRLMERALEHPIRLRILEMHRREPERSMSIASLTADLDATPEYEGVSLAQVKYHRDRLLDAKLLAV